MFPERYGEVSHSMETRRVSCPGWARREEVRRSHLKFWDVPFLLIGMGPIPLFTVLPALGTAGSAGQPVRKAAAKGVCIRW